MFLSDFLSMMRSIRPYLWAGALLLGSLIISIAFGAVYIQPGTVLGVLLSQIPGVEIPINWSDAHQTIILSVRLPHTLLIIFTGAALAGSGAAYQGLFRNPLADPYLIGVASGAGLGAVFALAVSWPENMLGFYLIPVAAFIGALGTVLVVYFMARVGQMVPLTTLILAGVAVSAFTSALTSFLMLRSDDQLYRAISFLLGGSPMSGWRPVLASLPYIVIGLVLLSISGHALNVLQFGEDQARQMGLPVERAKVFVVIVASMTTAVAVAFSGVIGFIGLIVPHLIRMVWGGDYKQLLPLSILFGGSALLLADLLARVLLAPQTLPVGIVTALAGAPFFLWILRRAKKQVFW